METPEAGNGAILKGYLTMKQQNINDKITTAIKDITSKLSNQKAEEGFEYLISNLKNILNEKLNNENVDIRIETELPNINPNDKTIVILCSTDLNNKVIDGGNFDDVIFVNISACYAKFNNCRFRNASFLCCDLRYIEVNGGTFEKAKLYWCDLYRAYFQGVVWFQQSLIAYCSLNSTYFSGGVLIRKDNLYNNILLQEDKKNYKNFIRYWDNIRPQWDKIKNDDGKSGDEKINNIVSNRFYELELIYKNLSSSFSANGFINDSNWAYVKGKRMERVMYIKSLSLKKLFSKNLISQIKIFIKIVSNWIFDIAFGYGESLLKILITYCVIVLIFTCIYMYRANIDSFPTALFISFKNMIGASSPELDAIHDFIISVLNLIQTTIGILTTGIFGFILGNKIRNQ